MRKRMPAARAVLFCVSAGRNGKPEQFFYQARPQDQGLDASQSENLTAGRPEGLPERALKRLDKKRNPAKRRGRDARGKGCGIAPVLRRLCALAAAYLLAAVSHGAAQAEEIDISARAAILIDAASGRVLYAKNADARCPMASTTKIMTALLALENSAPNEIVTASERAAGTGGTSIYLSAGETLSMEEMLKGLMLRSGNDAAVAIAEHIGGSVENFAAMMNARAEELGADAHFVTPNGLDAEGHGASARAMALIAREALRRDDFRALVGAQRATIPWRDNQYNRVLNNKNRLLREYEGATGVKTGFTKKAGRCLVFSAERDGMELIGVVLNCGAWFDEAERLLDWGFENFSIACAAEMGEDCGSVAVAGGASPRVRVIAESDAMAAVRASDQWSVELTLARSVAAPVHAGDSLGRAALKVNGEILAETRLIAAESSERLTFWGIFVKVLGGWPLGALFVEPIAR